MPSALETLVKILKLEQDTGYKNMAVIGGLQSYADNWARDAHQQAKRPEHHQLVDEMVHYLHQYGALENTEERHESVKYMIGRIMGRIPAPANLPPAVQEPPAEAEVPPPSEKPAPPTAPPIAVPKAAPLTAPPKPTPAPAVLEKRSEEEPEEEAEFEEGPEEDLGELVLPLAVKIVPDEVRVPPILPPTAPPRRRRAALSLEEAEKRLQALQSPVKVLHKVGDKMAEKLQRLGAETVFDMLMTFPRRYDDYSQMRTLNRIRPGETVTVAVSVQSAVKQQGKGGQPYLLVIVDDETGSLQVIFFGQLWLQRQFKPGSQVVLSGQVGLFRGKLVMTNPEWEMLERENLHTRRIVPIYPLTKGLSARTMRRLMFQVASEWASRVPDYMPKSVLERANLADLGWSIQQIHFPESHDYLAHARTRLSFDELFLFQMTMMIRRRDWQSVPGQPVQVPDEWLEQFLAALPYALTHAQRRALSDIRADMARDVPMNRLLQGDVGSGKTVVAAAAMAMAVQQGRQATLMVPTSILAEQHMRTISDLLRHSPDGERIQVRLLTGSTPDSERQEITAGLADGRVQVVIGTHALIQETVTFNNLALIIVDEQHRFGVEQRGALRGKGFNPHVLVMTATPIPRTLALTLYADLDLILLDEMPPGRMPVETRIIQPIERERAYSFIRSQLNQGRQAFIIYPLVESSEKMEEENNAAVDEYERLSRQVFTDSRVGLLHGRMKSAEKEATMAAFGSGALDILVSTSVVEVGIDVPNASVMLIESANRFGLAQLHQFRGRVGRGQHTSYCLLIAETSTPEAEQRLKAMEETNDGFKLAEIDWELRGPGDLLGVRQSGIGSFRLAELMNAKLVELAQREARTLYAEDPLLNRPEHQHLARRIRSFQDRRADVS